VKAGKASATALDEQWQQYLAKIGARGEANGSERKQSRSRRKEQEIRRAALRVFARDGISRARIQDVAAEAGLPVSTLYEYCSGKEELAYQVPASTFAAFFDEYIAAVGSASTARERLRLYLVLAADFARRNPEWARLLYLEIWPSVFVGESPLQQLIDDYVRIILYLIRDGERRGEWRAGPDPYETAAILNGSVNQVIITALLYRRPRNLTKAAESIVDRAMTLLQPPASKPPTRLRGTAKG